MDDDIRDEFTLDGIVTLVDAAHISQQLVRSNESIEQVAFADVLVLNKTDLVSTDTLNKIEARLKDVNPMTKFLRAERADIPVDTVLSLGAFNLDQILLRRPTFLEPEYPFEWTGVYTLKEGRYELSLNDGPDPNMSLIALANQDVDEDSLRAGAEWCVRGYSQPAQKLQPGCEIPIDKHIDFTTSVQRSRNLSSLQLGNK